MVSAASLALIIWRLDVLSGELDVSQLLDAWWLGRFYLLAALVLMPLNIWLEGVKWRLAARGLMDLPIGRAVRAVLRGVALSYPLTTTLGEHTSRLALFPRALLARAVPVSILCGASQFLASITGLSIGLALLGEAMGPWAILTPWSWAVTGFCWVGFMSFPILWQLGGKVFAWRFPFLLKLMPDTPWPRRAAMGGLSLVRYGVYLSQYLLLLIGSGAVVTGQPVTDTAARLTLIFGVKAVVPLFSFVGLAPLRELLALELLLPTGAPALAILSGGLLLWVVNQGVTGLAGVVVLLRYSMADKAEPMP